MWQIACIKKKSHWVQNTGVPHFTKLILSEELQVNWKLLQFIMREK